MRTTPLLLATAALLAPLQGREVREEILLIVNGHIITRHAYKQGVEQESANLYRTLSGKELDTKLAEARESTLKGMIDAFLVQDKAEDLGVKIPEEALRAHVEQIKKENNFASDADFERALRASLGIGMDDYIKRMKQQFLQQEVMRREIYSKIAIEDQELRAYYEDHRDEYKLPSRFRLRELVIAKGATPEELAAAKANLDKAQAELKAGKPFEELVKAYSTAPSKDTGGDLGWMNRGLLRKEVEEAALAQKAWGVSGPIETDKDYLLVQLVASENDVAKPFAEVKDEILKKLQEPKSQNAIDQFLQNLRTRANIRYLVPKEDILKG